MGSSPRLGIRGKFRLQCHRIWQLQTDDTAFCWGRAERLGLGPPVPDFSVPERYLSLCFRNLWVTVLGVT